jgi:hypothetical protein
MSRPLTSRKSASFSGASYQHASDHIPGTITIITRVALFYFGRALRQGGVSLPLCDVSAPGGGATNYGNHMSLSTRTLGLSTVVAIFHWKRIDAIKPNKNAFLVRA